MVFDKTDEQKGKMEETVRFFKRALEARTDAILDLEFEKGTGETQAKVEKVHKAVAKAVKHFAGGDRIKERAGEWLPNMVSRK